MAKPLDFLKPDLYVQMHLFKTARYWKTYLKKQKTGKKNDQPFSKFEQALSPPAEAGARCSAPSCGGPDDFHFPPPRSVSRARSQLSSLSAALNRRKGKMKRAFYLYVNGEVVTLAVALQERQLRWRGGPPEDEGVRRPDGRFAVRDPVCSGEQ